MKKLLRLDSIEAGGRSKEQVHDVLAARCIITPHADLPVQEAEELATQASLSADTGLQAWHQANRSCTQVRDASLGLHHGDPGN